MANFQPSTDNVFRRLGITKILLKDLKKYFPNSTEWGNAHFKFDLDWTILHATDHLGKHYVTFSDLSSLFSSYTGQNYTDGTFIIDNLHGQQWNNSTIVTSLFPFYDNIGHTNNDLKPTFQNPLINMVGGCSVASFENLFLQGGKFDFQLITEIFTTTTYDQIELYIAYLPSDTKQFLTLNIN